MQMVQSFDVRWVSTAIHLCHFYLIWSQTCLFCFFWRHHDTPISTCLSLTDYLSGSQHSQLIPKASHAASTSGPALCRYTFSCRNVPLNCTVRQFGFTSLTSGASHSQLPLHRATLPYQIPLTILGDMSKAEAVCILYKCLVLDVLDAQRDADAGCYIYGGAD